MSTEEKENPSVYTSSVQKSFYDIYITDIDEPRKHLEQIDVIRNAKPFDDVNLYFNSPGGHLWTAVQFISAIKQSGALVHGIIEGTCHSAASIIFLACDSYDVPEFASMLCHNVTTGFNGKMHEVQQWNKHTEKHVKYMFKEFYKDFLTEDEFSLLNEGKDFWFAGKEIVKRLKFRDSKNKKGKNI